MSSSSFFELRHRVSALRRFRFLILNNAGEVLERHPGDLSAPAEYVWRLPGIATSWFHLGLDGSPACLGRLERGREITAMKVAHALLHGFERSCLKRRSRPAFRAADQPCRAPSTICCRAPLCREEGE
jgi:hypothetical protein